MEELNDLNLNDFLNDKLNNFKNFIISNSMNKNDSFITKINDLFQKLNPFFIVMMINEDNKESRIKTFIKFAELQNTDNNYKVINDYLNMILEIKKTYFSDN